MIARRTRGETPPSIVTPKQFNRRGDRLIGTARVRGFLTCSERRWHRWDLSRRSAYDWIRKEWGRRTGRRIVDVRRDLACGTPSPQWFSPRVFLYDSSSSCARVPLTSVQEQPSHCAGIGCSYSRTRQSLARLDQYYYSTTASIFVNPNGSLT